MYTYIKRIDEYFVDTKETFTKDECKSINNLFSYMDNKYYNESTLENDIDVVFNCYLKNNYLLKDLDPILIRFVNEISRQISNFAYLMENRNDNFYYQQYLLFANLPLRFSRNPQIDIKIIKSFFREERYSYDQLLLDLVHMDLYKNTNFVNDVYHFNFFYGVDPVNFGKYSKMGWVNKYPESNSDINSKFEEAKYYFNKDKTLYISNKELTNAVGYKAELDSLSYIKSIIDSNDKIIWVSRKIGDGFGYDILTHNDSTNVTKLFEIKGTLLEKCEGVIELSKYESIVHLNCIKDNIEHHAIQFFYDKDVTRIYDVKTLNNSLYLNQENGKGYTHVLKSYSKYDKNKTVLGIF